MTKTEMELKLKELEADVLRYAEAHRVEIRECGLPECHASYIVSFGDIYCSIGCWYFAKERRKGC